MKQLIATVAAIATAISFGGNVCTYTGASATAPGDWADAGNWDVTPVGGNDDIIIIPSGKTAFIDASSEAVRKIVEDGFAEIKMIGRIGEAAHPASLVVTVDEDDEPLTLNGKILGYRRGVDDKNADASSGLVVKRGKGALRLKPTLGGGDLYTNFTVEEGDLYLPQEVSSVPNFHDICISNNATLHIAAKTGSKVNNNIYRLTGGGVVTNSHANGYSDIQVHISGECEFAGRLTNVRLFGKGKVYLTGTDSTMTSYVTAQASSGAGTIGFAKVGLKGDVSSVGVAAGLAFGNGGGAFVYLGTGETTDKELRWQYPKTQKCFLSGGSHGGLVFDTASLWDIAYTTVAGNKGMASIGLSGENPTNACVMAGAINASTDEADRTNRLYITKTGRGIWRFGDNAKREGVGGIAVEDGTLQFDTLAEKGIMCALGTAVDCHTNYYGTYDAEANADYAFSAGSATTEGTFEYMGSNSVWVMQRPMVLNGDVRFRNNGGASFRFANVKPKTAGGKTVTLDGSGMGENVIADVFDNPSAPVSVVKEGSGVWMLANTNSLHGQIIVKGGTLKIASQSGKYTWFLWTLKDVLYPDSVTKCSVSEFCLYEKAEGYARANAGMAAAASYADIQPGQVAFFTGKAVSGAIGSMLDGVYMNSNGFQGAIDEKAPTNEDEATHIPVLMRFADSAPEIDRYDFSCRFGYNTENEPHWAGNPKAWTLQGSVDGFHWNMLHEVRDATAAGCEMPARSNNNRFYAAGTNLESDMNTGTNAQVFVSRAMGTNPLLEIASLQVVSNATLEAIGDALEIGNIVVDIHSGGTFKNFKFAETGTIDINENGSGVHELPLSFENCTGIDRIAGWSLNVAGAPTAKRRISVSGGKVYIVPQGFVLSFR